MSEIKIYISPDTRKHWEKTNPDLLRDIDDMNSHSQDDINSQWNREQGPPRRNASD